MITGFLPQMSDNEPKIGDDIMQNILYTIQITGIMVTDKPASRAFKIKKAFDELPRVKTMVAIKNTIKLIFLKLFAVEIDEDDGAPSSAVSFVNLMKNKAKIPGITENKKTRRMLSLNK